jgi:GH35 family endo-1,4-beta-xylanase
MCKHNWETFDYDGKRSILYCTKCEKTKVKFHTLFWHNFMDKIFGFAFVK